jgi:hypothetical protein
VVLIVENYSALNNRIGWINDAGRALTDAEVKDAIKMFSTIACVSIIVLALMVWKWWRLAYERKTIRLGNEDLPLSLRQATKTYRWRLFLVALSPTVFFAMWSSGVPGFLSVAGLIFVTWYAAWPSVRQRVPTSYWVVASACWMVGGFVGAVVMGFIHSALN